VHRIVAAHDLLAEVGELAARLAAGPTAAYAAIKQSVAFGMSHSLDETLERESALQAACGQTVDHREAVEAFLTKRKATFVGH
jgi:2-(1,2-epoxy-1,2-dihydrophenyl)acetyl-CoA isomerase